MCCDEASGSSWLYTKSLVTSMDASFCNVSNSLWQRSADEDAWSSPCTTKSGPNVRKMETFSCHSHCSNARFTSAPVTVKKQGHESKTMPLTHDLSPRTIRAVSMEGSDDVIDANDDANDGLAVALAMPSSAHWNMR